MPKYYRFRATTPTRKHWRSHPRDNDGPGVVHAEVDEAPWLQLSPLGESPAQSWYRRRTSWRDQPPPLPPRLRTFVHLTVAKLALDTARTHPNAGNARTR